MLLTSVGALSPARSSPNIAHLVSQYDRLIGKSFDIPCLELRYEQDDRYGTQCLDEVGSIIRVRLSLYAVIRWRVAYLPPIPKKNREESLLSGKNPPGIRISALQDTHDSP
jgi:hypothetical protein